MKRKKKKKRWLDRRSQRIQKKKNKPRHPGSAHQSKGIRAPSNLVPEPYIAKAPKVFSFRHNTEGTTEYFVDIIRQIEKKVFRQKFYLDLAEIEIVTVDAVMYILAVLYNIKHNRQMRYSFGGNFPEANDARQVFMDSGFVNYVSTKKAVMPKARDNVQILTGKQTDSLTAKKICDFVNLHFGTDYRFTIDLYQTLIELMSNTVHHAYDEKSLMVPSWYIYAVENGEVIQFSFLDTGAGIPNTVKRKFIEKIPLATSDSSLIYSSFLGESRTETGLYNRGHGLPALREKIICGKLQNFYVCSGTGMCYSELTDEGIALKKREHNQKIYGTIYQFEIKNERKCYVD